MKMQTICYPGKMAFYYANKAAEDLLPLDLYKLEMEENDLPTVSDEEYENLLEEYYRLKG